MSKATPIPGNTVFLRPINDGEVEQACSWRNDPSVSHLFYRRNVAPAQMRSDIREMRSNRSGDTLAVVRSDTGDFIGTLTYSLAVHSGAATATLGILVGPDSARGKGYGANAINALGAWLASELGVNKILVEVKPGNSGAITFYEKIGFAPRAVIMERDADPHA